MKFSFVGLPGIPLDQTEAVAPEPRAKAGIVKEAEVSCKAGHIEWVDWEHRHDNEKCANCKGIMRYTGHWR